MQKSSTDSELFDKLTRAQPKFGPKTDHGNAHGLKYPCVRKGIYRGVGHCVPKRECCSKNLWQYNHFDSGDCGFKQFCCIHDVLCQSCSEGTRDVNNRCVDINECEETYGLCSGHGCVNINGSYTCQCLPGYQINGNESNVEMLYSGTLLPQSIDYSIAGNYMAWIDMTLNQINVAPIVAKTASLVSERTAIRFSKNPICVTIDWIHDLLYWIDLDTRTINVLNVLKPYDYYPVVNVTNQEPHDLVVNVMDNSLVWNHLGIKPRIVRSFQDGSNETTLYSNDKQIFCLSIDVFIKRYYFLDIHFTLYSIDFNGADERKIFSSGSLLNNINSLS
ncbi:unnamed protein product, partial [Medioppia subpectinata]